MLKKLFVSAEMRILKARKFSGRWYDPAALGFSVIQHWVFQLWPSCMEVSNWFALIPARIWRGYNYAWYGYENKKRFCEVWFDDPFLTSLSSKERVVSATFNPLLLSDAVRKHKKSIPEDLFSSVLSQYKKHHPSWNRKFKNLGIFKSLKLHILKGKNPSNFS